VSAHPPIRLSQLETECIRVLWQKENASVAEVKSAMERPLAYTTVMTVLDRLIDKGAVVRRKHGRAYLYSPALDLSSARSQAIRRLLENLFDHDAQALVQFILDNGMTHPGGTQMSDLHSTDRGPRPRKMAIATRTSARVEIDESLL
jgi:predicted transcriptional regulator